MTLEIPLNDVKLNAGKATKDGIWRGSNVPHSCQFVAWRSVGKLTLLDGLIELQDMAMMSMD